MSLNSDAVATSKLCINNYIIYTVSIAALTLLTYPRSVREQLQLGAQVIPRFDELFTRYNASRDCNGPTWTMWQPKCASIDVLGRVKPLAKFMLKWGLFTGNVCALNMV
jgi:hypothetical protein